MSNFSNIGFKADTIDEYSDLGIKVIDTGTRKEFDGGAYAYCQDPSGAEVWLQVTSASKDIGLNPYFRGESKRLVSLLHEVKQEDKILGYTVKAWADPQDSSSGDSGLYPFTFEIINGAEYTSILYPQNITIQLSAFPQGFSIYNNEEDFHSSSDGNFAVHSFVPQSSLFEDEGTDSPYGFLTGTNREYKKVKNEMSSNFFYSFLIDTLGGEMDVVIDANLIDEPPSVGGVIQGVFWLVGSFVDEPQIME